MPEFPGFIGPSYIAPSITQDDQELINLFVEIDPTKQQGERGYASLYPTPGLAIRSIAGLGPIRGLWTIPGGTLCFVVSGSGVAAFSGNFFGVPTLVATLLSSFGPVSMTDNGMELFIADGVARYAFNWSTAVFTVLTDGPWTSPNSADIVDVIDNFVIYNNPGTNQWAATSAGSHATPALSFGRKDSTPDNIVSLIVNRREIYLLGERTTEVWVDAGTFPFPFQRLDGAVMQHGCTAKFSAARLGESFAWLAQDSRGESIIVTISGNYEPVRISTHAVESDIAAFPIVSDATAYTYQQEGHEFYVINFPSGDRTWVYDLANGAWHKRAWRDTNNVLHRHRGNCMAFFQGLCLVGDWQNGNIYSYSLTKFVDEVANTFGSANPMPISCIRRAPHLTTELKRQFFHDFQIQFQPGVGLQTGQGSNPQAMLRWSDDGGSTWSSEHWVSIGKVGKYKNRARWQRLGQARDRIFEVQVTDPVYRTMVSANINYSAGGS